MCLRVFACVCARVPREDARVCARACAGVSECVSACGCSGGVKIMACLNNGMLIRMYQVMRVHEGNVYIICNVHTSELAALIVMCILLMYTSQ